MDNKEKTTMTMDELKDVSGGYVEDMSSLPTEGWNIICPYCGEDNVSIRSASDLLIDTSRNTVEYTCSSCGRSFVVEGDTGIIHKKEDWKELLAKQGHKYKY